MTARPPLSERVDPLAHLDPVAAVAAAHESGRSLLLGTSGSSGPARGVARSTASWFDSFPTVARLTELDETARVWVPGPLVGTMNLFAAVLTRWVGARQVDAVEDATHAHVTPTVLRRLVDRGDVLDGLRVTVAGDGLGAGLYRRAADAGAVVTHYYGAAELSFVAWGTHQSDLRPFPGVAVRARDGVLWARSPYLAEVATDADGFATAGDEGSVTPDGRVAVRGRGGAAVTTGGATVPVQVVEAALGEVVGGDVLVVGLPHADLGEVVAAVLTRVSDVSLAHDRARRALPATHRPRVWFVADEIPRTPAGKPDRVALRVLAARGDLRRLRPLADGSSPW